MDTWYVTKELMLLIEVQCLRIVVSTHRTDVVGSNALASTSTQATQQACGLRWKIE
ncbi:MAG: hypothetical protein KME27_05990 [Lyngbya sp. HA4199-MV5]|nr:hypothetical protein [Lyngbya sp. HA4199-MV5]